MLAWLNPMNWIKILSLLKSIWDIATSVYKWVTDYFRKKKQEAAQSNFKQAEKELEDANKIEDVNERLKAKAAAAKKMEDALRNTPNN